MDTIAMAEPDISVVIPTYQRNESLRTALTSVATQEYDGSVEAIVLDNSETTKAQSVVDEFPFATYHWQLSHVPRQEEGHKNVAIARDLGIYYANGEYVHFLDDDDELHRWALRWKMSAIRADPRAKAAYSGFEKSDGSTVHMPERVIGNELRFVLAYHRTPGLPSTLLVERAVLEECPSRYSLPHDDICGMIEILLRTPIVYVDAALTKRNDSPSLARSIETQRARLKTYGHYAGLRRQILPDDVRAESRRQYEQIRETVRGLSESDGEDVTESGK